MARTIVLLGTWDPANIFRHVNLPSRNQVRQLMSTLSALSTLSQLTQLQGCTPTSLSTSPFAMVAVATDVQFGMKVIITWLVMLIGYGVYLSLRYGSTSARTEVFEGDSDGITSVESPQTEMGSDEEPEPEGEGDNDGDMPLFSPESMVRWMYSRCTRSEEQAARNNNMAKVVNYQRRKPCCKRC